MSRKAIVLRAAAIASSVLLLVGFIAYRVGAIDRLWAPRPAEFMGGSKTKMILTRDDVEKLQSDPGDLSGGGTVGPDSRSFMAGSKSAVVVTPQAPVVSAEPAPSSSASN